MKKTMLLFSIIFSGQITFAQTEKAQAEVAMLERRRFEAQVKKDYDFLEKVFSDDLIYTHGSGKVDNKTTYIQSIRDGKSVYDNIQIEAIGVRTYNNQKTAVVNGEIVIDNANSAPARLRYAVVYIKHKKLGWQLVMWQALKIG